TGHEDDRPTTTSSPSCRNQAREESMFHRRWIALAFACGLVGGATTICAAGDDAAAIRTTLRFGWQAATPVTTFWAGFEIKKFEAQGLKLELSSFNDNAPEIEALVARKIDMAAVA